MVKNTIERNLGDQGVMPEYYFNFNLFIVPEECWQCWNQQRSSHYLMNFQETVCLADFLSHQRNFMSFETRQLTGVFANK